MRRTFRFVLYVFLCALLLWLLLSAPILRPAALEALSLCAHSVIPALLPVFVISDLLITLGLGQALSPLLSPLMAVYRLPGAAGSALVLGLLGGYPVGVRTAARLYGDGLLTRKEAEQLLTFCSNAGPAFFLTVLGGGVFHSLRVGALLWLIHLLSALLTGLLLRGRPGQRAPAVGPVPTGQVSFPAALSSSLARSGGAMVSVCACVVFFYTVTTPLRFCRHPAAALALGLTELFSLLPRLAPTPSGFLLAALCSGWGGVSVLCQSAAALEGSGLSLGPLVRGKVCQALLSLLLAVLALPRLR